MSSRFLETRTIAYESSCQRVQIQIVGNTEKNFVPREMTILGFENSPLNVRPCGKVSLKLSEISRHGVGESFVFAWRVRKEIDEEFGYLWTNVHSTFF